MRKLLLATSLIVITGIISSLVVAKTPFWRGEVLKQEEVAQRWGGSKFDAAKFKAASLDERRAMAASLLSQKDKFIGKFVTNIREELGQPDGFYFTDIFPAYMIQRAKDHSEESWQIVFLLDKNRKVEDVVVHKNCCS